MAVPLIKLSGFLRLIKFSHSLFALPFALTSVVFAARWGLLPGRAAWELVLWVVLAMVGARSGAMGFNRLVDIQWDAQNPRTENRPSVTGEVSKPTMGVMILLSFALLVFAAWKLNPLAFYLSPVAIVLVSFYSLTKRFTALCHLFLGLAIGVAPVAAWVAVRGEVSATSLVLGLSVLCWITGFDILYALQDVEFDRQVGLHSIPVRLGVANSLNLSRLLHLGALACWVWLTWALQLGVIWQVGVGVATGFLVYEHLLLKGGDLRKLDLAFFNLNAYLSMTLFLAALGDFWWG